MAAGIVSIGYYYSYSNYEYRISAGFVVKQLEQKALA